MRIFGVEITVDFTPPYIPDTDMETIETYAPQSEEDHEQAGQAIDRLLAHGYSFTFDADEHIEWYQED